MSVQAQTLVGYRGMASGPKFTTKITPTFTRHHHLAPSIINSLEPSWPSSSSSSSSSSRRILTTRAATAIDDKVKNQPSSNQMSKGVKRSIIKWCRNGETSKAANMLETLCESGAVVPHVISYNKIIAGYGKEGNLDKAIETFERMKVAPNPVTFDALMKGLCGSGRTMELLESRLRGGCTLGTYRILLAAVCRVMGVKKWMELLDWMRKRGYPPKAHTYNVVIVELFRVRLIDQVLELVADMKDNKIEPNEKTHTLLGLFGLQWREKLDEAIDPLEASKASN